MKRLSSMDQSHLKVLRKFIKRNVALEREMLDLLKETIPASEYLKKDRQLTSVELILLLLPSD